MSNVLETLRRSIFPDRAETRRKPTSAEASKTILAILGELDSCVTGSHSLTEMKREFSELGTALTEAYQKDLTRLKQAAEDKGKKWVGHLEFSASFPRRDGLDWEGITAIETGEEGISVISNYHGRISGWRTKHIKAQGEFSPDGRFLRRVCWEEEISFGPSLRRGRTSLLHRIEVNFRNNNEIARVKVKWNVHPNRENRLTKAFVVHEVRL